MPKTAGSGAIRRALSGKPYRYYAIGSGCALIGTWVQRLGVGWLTWHLTESGTWLGLIAFADIVPALALLPLTGAVADRVDKLKLLRLTQFLQFCEGSALALLTYLNVITIELLLVLTLIQGTITAFNQPVRLALVPNLVKREDMAAAIGIHSLLFNIARFIGPALAGWMIVEDGVALAFAVNAATHLLFAVALAAIRLVQADTVSAPKSLGDIPAEIVAGFRYAMRHEGIGGVLFLTLMIGVFGRAYVELLPGFAAQVFGQGADGLAIMTSSVGGGAILAGIWISQRGRVSGLMRIQLSALLAMIVTLFGFAATDVFWIGLFCLAAGGFCMSVNGISGQILVQAAVESTMRGRVLGVYGLLSRGGPGLGALLMGALSGHFGLQWPIAGGAVVCLLAWFWIWRRRKVMTRQLEVEPAI